MKGIELYPHNQLLPKTALNRILVVETRRQEGLLKKTVDSEAVMSFN